MKRLSDEELERLAECSDGEAVGLIAYRAKLGMLQEQIGKAVAELRERRAADLSDEERSSLGALRFLLGKHSHEPYAYDGENMDRAFMALDRILAAGGGR